MNGSLFWRNFSSVISFSRELIGSLSINPDSTVHRGRLQYISCEIFLNDRFDSFFGEGINYFLIYFQRLYGMLEVIRGCRTVESDGGRVGL